jgi:hypothetical protein
VVFLAVLKAFDAVQVNRLTILNFPVYLVKLVYSYLFRCTFEVSFQSATSSGCGMHAGMAWGGIIFSVPSSQYVSDILIPPYHAELAVYADHTAISHILLVGAVHQLRGYQ